MVGDELPLTAMTSTTMTTKASATAGTHRDRYQERLAGGTAVKLPRGWARAGAVGIEGAPPEIHVFPVHKHFPRWQQITDHESPTPHAPGTDRRQRWVSKVGRVPVYMTLTAKRGDRSMRKVAASLFLSLAVAAEQPDAFVTDVDDATESNLRGVSR